MKKLIALALVTAGLAMPNPVSAQQEQAAASTPPPVVNTATAWWQNQVTPAEVTVNPTTTLDFTLASQFGAIRGTVADFDGSAAPYSTSATLIPQERGVTGAGIGTVLVRVDGSYEFNDVPAGNYWLRFTTGTRSTTDRPAG